MGLGSFGGGLGATRYLVSRGARVCVTDLRSAEQLAPALGDLAGLEVETVLGRHRREDFEAADLVVANPAVGPDNDYLAAGRAAGARITSEIELFLEAARGRLACVTGTQGKSSTCHLLAALLSHAGMRARPGGNIGGSLLEAVDAIDEEEIVVLELSSYQLAALDDPSALGDRVEVVAVTNVLADHLERHGSIAAYARAKARILGLVEETGIAVLPAGDDRFTAPPGRALFHGPAATAPPRVAVSADCFLLEREGGVEVLGRVEDLRLPGAFQRENAAVALGAARLLGADPEALAAGLGRVEGLEHRLEDLGLVAGRRIRDNGVSTTPDSTLSALAATSGAPTLLVGGRKKDLPLEELAREVAARAVPVVAFGEAGPELARALRDAGAAVTEARGVEEAVEEAFRCTEPGGEILFSPACSSFDAYPNFKARAGAFRAALAARGWVPGRD